MTDGAIPLDEARLMHWPDLAAEHEAAVVSGVEKRTQAQYVANKRNTPFRRFVDDQHKITDKLFQFSVAPFLDDFHAPFRNAGGSDFWMGGNPPKIRRRPASRARVACQTGLRIGKEPYLAARARPRFRRRYRLCPLEHDCARRRLPRRDLVPEYLILAAQSIGPRWTWPMTRQPHTRKKRALRAMIRAHERAEKRPMLLREQFETALDGL